MPRNGKAALRYTLLKGIKGEVFDVCKAKGLDFKWDKVTLSSISIRKVRENKGDRLGDTGDLAKGILYRKLMCLK